MIAPAADGCKTLLGARSFVPRVALADIAHLAQRLEVVECSFAAPAPGEYMVDLESDDVTFRGRRSADATAKSVTLHN